MNAGESTVRLFTIGSTGKSAEEFFGRLPQAGVRLLLDTRLHNLSQLAGFATQQLRWITDFARSLVGGIALTAM